jgi:hypothetical protein
MSEIDYQEVAKQVISNRAFTEAIGSAFGTMMAEATKSLTEKASLPVSPSYGGNVHGIGSMFGAVQVGIEPEVISAMMHWRGIGEVIPKEATRFIEMFLPFITGVDPTSSTEPTNECDDCISGESEACIQHFPTGKVCRETKAMDIHKLVERVNRGDIDLRLLNDQLGNDAPWHPGSLPNTQADLMQIATAWALLYELPPLFMQALGPMVYTGNPVNNNGNAYREFRGLDLLVNTGFVDAFANVTCPALDSDLKDFNYEDVQVATNPSFYEVLEMAHYYVRNNARGQRLDPASWVVVMRPELWQIFSSLVPYQSILATMMRASANIPTEYEIAIAGNELAQERDRIRAAHKISLNGQIVTVIEDDGITEIDDATDTDDMLVPGEFASDVYVLPLSFLANRPAMRIEYKDYRYLSGEIAATDDLIEGFYKWSPDGRFAWSLVRDGPCFKIRATIEPRIILRTPQLAARIQNVKYVPLQHLRTPDPDSPYRFKGGVSTRAPSSYYH